MDPEVSRVFWLFLKIFENSRFSYCHNSGLPIKLCTQRTQTPQTTGTKTTNNNSTAIIEIDDVRQDEIGRLSFLEAMARNLDVWVPACQGTETPFRTRSGRTLLYCFNPGQARHAYIDCGTDMETTNEEAFELIGC